MATLIVVVPVVPAWMVAVIVAREFAVSGLRLAALQRGVVVSARDLSKLKTWSQSVAVCLGGLAAGGAFSDEIAWWGLLVAAVLTVVSGLEYAWHAPSLLRGRQPA
jgi:CDP-diacylglycerol--glycerol-3-phosphate 3-phosphatidyltransferase